eukprot:CAMPEP_0176150456 /NCGR_PEP_ID=MMETSP0120_2-20121206/76814_1 /TAXON_ID=160619 /ORGANISM="Kryptoperidinium foliaceum, Strain CCMP 1326" /LENGTH=423 /DNA_ID=CAMNT_0017487361 /DNA_START=57 /DNA_END=1327 /DNA_ORIENTATION=-
MTDVFDVVRDLASTRADSLNGRKRKELMDLAIQSLEMSTQERKVLANRKDLVCWSKFGYQRLAKLLCVAFLAEKEKPQLRHNLCLRMCNVIMQSGDAKIIKSCRHYSSKFPREILDSIAKENLAAWALLPECEWDHFVKLTLGDRIATSKDMAVVGSRIANIPLESWESTVGPALVTKLKSKPESVIDVVKSLSEYLPSDLVARSKVIQSDLLPAVLKQIKSAKDTVREAAYMSADLGCSAVKAGYEKIDGAQITLSAIVKAAADTKSLTQIVQRQAIYVALRTIGDAVVSRKVALDPATVSEVLTGIRTPLAKEAKTAMEARQQGLEALFLDGKRNGGAGGYDEALAYMRNPVVLKNGPESQLVLGTLGRKLHPDVLESIVLDLWKDEKFVRGVEGLIEAANKKHAASSSIAQIEGLLAVYI